MPLPISATIITLNEEQQIGDCIRNLQQVCDEIIVIDSLSTDRTVEIAEALGAKVIAQAYLGDGQQKAFGVQFASNDWILSIDADERLDATLVESIRELDLNQVDADAFEFNRKSYIGEQWVKVWYPDYLIRLYNKQSAGFEAVGGHARVQSENARRIRGHIIHYSYPDYGEVIRKVHRFTTRGARISHEQGKKANALSPFVHGLGAFIKAWVFKKGILHGITGLNVAVISAFSSYAKYMIMLEMQQQDAKKRQKSD